MNSGKTRSKRVKQVMPDAPELPVAASSEITSRKAFSFGTWSKIFPDHMNVPLWALLCVPAFSLVLIHFLSDEPQAWTLYAAVALVAVFLLRWLTEYLRKLATYAEYKKFPLTLGFELQGWEYVGAFTNQLKYRHWSDETVLQVFVFDHATQGELKLMKAALDTFLKNSGKHFYYREGESNWEYHGSLRIRGSSDSNVIGDLYTLINVHLRRIQEKHKVIRAVSVKFDPNIRHREPPASTDTMS
jgi:hypothetical protein